MVNAVPKDVTNWIAGAERPAASGQWFDKRAPATGEVLTRAARSSAADVAAAVAAAEAAQPAWAATPAVQRGMLLHRLADLMEAHKPALAQTVALETGKSPADATGETGGAIALGLFYASEGQRLYGRTTTSGVANRMVMAIRQPIGVAGLIVPANTPIANVAWKLFPALVCGNTVVLKASEDAPATAWWIAKLAAEAGLPHGTVNVVQGLGAEAGAALVEHPGVGVVSFTGSTNVGRRIQQVAGDRFARVSLELGGKNPLVICDDADLEAAVKWTILSAFSNAGQRCASGSRIIVFDAVYDRVRDMIVDRARALKVGPNDGDDYGPVINERQLNAMLSAITRAKAAGARVLSGGSRIDRPGYFLEPTVIDHVDPSAEVSCVELFGPITTLYRAADFADALRLANLSPYGLTSCIHTRSLHRALRFCEQVQAGLAVVNAGTYGSEPHLSFGGVKQSGNGTREPGTEAIDVYSSLKHIFLNLDPAQV